MKTDFTQWSSAEAMAALTAIEERVQSTGPDDEFVICEDGAECAADVCMLAAAIRTVIERKGQPR